MDKTKRSNKWVNFHVHIICKHWELGPYLTIKCLLMNKLFSFRQLYLWEILWKGRSGFILENFNFIRRHMMKNLQSWEVSAFSQLNGFHLPRNRVMLISSSAVNWSRFEEMKMERWESLCSCIFLWILCYKTLNWKTSWCICVVLIIFTS